MRLKLIKNLNEICEGDQIVQENWDTEGYLKDLKISQKDSGRMQSANLPNAAPYHEGDLKVLKLGNEIDNNHRIFWTNNPHLPFTLNELASHCDTIVKAATNNREMSRLVLIRKIERAQGSKAALEDSADLLTLKENKIPPTSSDSTTILDAPEPYRIQNMNLRFT